MTDPIDVLVVGGGPSGAVAAAVLARRGLRTLVVDAGASPASHEVVLTVRHQLRRLGGLPEAGVREVTALDLWFGGWTRRQIADAGMAVCDLARLREWLLQAALGAGAQPLVGEVAVLRASEHGQQAVLSDGRTFDARHLIVAAGPDAARRIASDDGTGGDGRGTTAGDPTADG